MNDQLSWLYFAREDLILAEAALEKEVYNQVCFHAHQGVEKALKAFLYTKQRSIPRIHSLSELLSMCKNLDKSFLDLDNVCISLDQYYIPTRYPDALPGTGKEGLPTINDAKEALNNLHTALRYIESKCP